MGLRAGLDTVKRKIFFLPLQGIETFRPARSLVIVLTELPGFKP
jgi:hypothetical protein